MKENKRSKAKSLALGSLRGTTESPASQTKNGNILNANVPIASGVTSSPYPTVPMRGETGRITSENANVGVGEREQARTRGCWDGGVMRSV